MLLAILALVLWLYSLSLTGLMSNIARPNFWRGFEILLMGWAGLLMGNLAWLANPLFAACLLRVFWRGARRPAGVLALLACVLALDTFRLQELRSETMYPVAGYGWGAVLWFAAMCVMLAAAGQQDRELAVRGVRPFGSWVSRMLPLGLVLAVLAVAAAAVLGMQQRQQGNSDERALFSELAFRRGAMCTIEPQVLARVPLTDTADPADAVLERLEPPAGLEMLSSFLFHRELLDLGLPVLRVQGRDFRWHYPTGEQGERMLRSVPASAQPARAQLLASQAEDGTVRIRIQAQQQGQQQTLVDEHWPGHAYNHCPLARHRTRLLSEALALQPVSYKTPPRKEAVVQAQMLERSDGAPSAMPDEHFRTLHCPASVGFRGDFNRRIYPGDPLSRLGVPFAMGDVHYHLPYYKRQAVCGGDAVYLFDQHLQGEFFQIKVDKRSLQDLRLLGSAVLTVPDKELAAEHMRLYVTQVQESATGLEMTLEVPELGLRGRIAAPVQALRNTQEDGAR